MSTSASLLDSFLGGLEASISVLLTLGYGVLASRMGLLGEKTVKDVSKLCNEMFLPALIVVNVGSQLNSTNLDKYWPVVVWSLFYILVSILLGWIAVRFLKFPAWVTIAAGFNNTTGLPLLLIQSLASTNILKVLLVGDDTMSKAIQRAKSYFLICSVIKNILVIGLGPRLLQAGERLDDHKDQEESNNQDENAHQEPTETSSLLPEPVSRVQKKVQTKYRSLPGEVQEAGSILGALVNPASIGAAIAVFLALIPVLHRLFFNPMEEGGWFKPWLTTSIENIGGLFTALQMFVVGSQLNHSLSSKKKNASISKSGLALSFGIRFVLWGVAGIGIIYLLASRTNLLSDDPILWFTMMLMPVGPPAMILATVLEVSGASEDDQTTVAKVLAAFYAVTPVICIAVAGALKMSEMAKVARGL